MPCSLATMNPTVPLLPPACPSPSSFPCLLPLTSFPLPLPSAGSHSQPWSGPPPPHLPCPARLPPLISRLPPHFGAPKAQASTSPWESPAPGRASPPPPTVLPCHLASSPGLPFCSVLLLCHGHPFWPVSGLQPLKQSALLSLQFSYPVTASHRLPAFCKLAQGPCAPASGLPWTSVSQEPAGRREQPVVGGSGAGWQASSTPGSPLFTVSSQPPGGESFSWTSIGVGRMGSLSEPGGSRASGFGGGPPCVSAKSCVLSRFSRV